MCFIKFIFLCLMFSYLKATIFDFNLFDMAKISFPYLEEQNYIYKNHTIVTEDGYELLLVQLHGKAKEISSNTTKPPLLLVHGLFGCFESFLIAGPGISIGFMALEHGYDVFLLNTRGNIFSKKHETLDPVSDADKFWNFSWHEIGVYDLSATIDYILKVTGHSKISYVCHSQGCTSFLVMASTIPAYNEKIKIAVLLAPASYMRNAHSTFKMFLEAVVTFAEIFDIEEISAKSSVIHGQLLCNFKMPFMTFCKTLLFEAALGPSSQVNETTMAAWYASSPSGASKKQLKHYLQLTETGFPYSCTKWWLQFNNNVSRSWTPKWPTMIMICRPLFPYKTGSPGFWANHRLVREIRQLIEYLFGPSDDFQAFDYGEDDNANKYGQSIPPSYNLETVTAPIAVYRGATDYIVSLIDSATLVHQLPNVVEDVIISSVKTNHLDVLVGLKVVELVNKPVLSVLNKYNNL